jgi:integrase
MEWGEFDRRARAWVIPAERTKQRREHVVPLAPQALALFAELHKLTGGGVYAFPNGRTAMKCMSEGTLAAALASIGYTPDVHTPHGFRSTASTMLHGSRQLGVGTTRPQIPTLVQKPPWRDLTLKAEFRALHARKRLGFNTVGQP